MHAILISIAGVVTLFASYLVVDSVSAIQLDAKEMAIGIVFLVAGLVIGRKPLLAILQQEGQRRRLLVGYAGIVILLVLAVAYQMTKIVGVERFQITDSIRMRKVVRSPLGKTLLFPGEGRFVKLSDGRNWVVPAAGLRNAHWYEASVPASDPRTGEKIRMPRKYGFPDK